MNEKQLEKWARAEALKRGVLPYKFRSPNKRGVPDQIFLYEGQTLFVEFKNPNQKGKLTPLQKKEIDLLRAQGFLVAVIDSKEDFSRLLFYFKAATTLVSRGLETLGLAKEKAKLREEYLS